jgi:orotate phosphoribosyltransferase
MGAIFSYGFEEAEQNLKNANCELFTLGNYETLISQALETKYISNDEVELLKEWRESPSTWKK